MTLNILLDENLSPTLVHELANKGVLAQQIVHLGRDGLSDPELWHYAYEHDQVVVTRNAGDFIRLARTSTLHVGLIVLRGEGLTRQRPMTVAASALSYESPTLPTEHSIPASARRSV